jgi:energy-coupling factor transporter ATP-binding protein EcfA2
MSSRSNTNLTAYIYRAARPESQLLHYEPSALSFGDFRDVFAPRTLPFVNDSSPRPTRFLPDVPADQDRFGPHRIIAEAIKNIVLHDPGGHSIGLTGSYGSGKSTVVELLQGALADQPNACVWVFDAWAHEGDPLRRTFLESLIQRLLSQRWIEQKRWEQQLEVLTHRYRRTETKNTYQITALAVALALALLLAPLGHALFREGLPGAQLWLPGREFNEFATFGLLLATLPVIVAAAGVAVGWRERRRDPSRHPLEELGALLVQKSANQVQTTTTESADPTSIEFERNFRDVMREALADQRRRLVLVIDNLDRVEPEDAQRVWSTLRTFLDPTTETQREDWLSRLWVIIPYDPSGIQRLWERSSKTEGQSLSAGLAKSFLDKTIDLTFNVPRPLLSNWRDYLIGLLEVALPSSIDSVEVYRIYRLLALTRGGAGQAPTPRELKIFVNQLSALFRLRGADVPLPDIAYYVILEREGHDIAAELLSGLLPRPQEQHLVSAGATLSLAALVFGVNREQGQQLLLADPIATALIQGNSAELQRLQTLTPAFGAVLEHVLGEATVDWAANHSTETANLLTAAQALADAKILDLLPEPNREHIQHILRTAALRTNGWHPLTPDSGGGLLALNHLLADAEVASHSVAAFSRGLARGRKEELKPAEIGRLAAQLAKGLDSLGFSAALNQGIEVPRGAGSYLEALRVVMDLVRDENDPRHPHLYVLRTSATPDETVAVLAERAEAGTFAQPDLFAIRTLSGGISEYDWQPLVTAISLRVESGTLHGPEEVNVLLAALQFLMERANSADANEALDGFYKSGSAGAAWVVCAGNREEHAQAQARLLYTQMVVDPAFKRVQTQAAAAQAVLQKVLSGPSAAVVRCLAGICENADRRDVLLSVGEKSADAKPLVGAVLRSLYTRGNSESFFSAQMIAAHWQLLPSGFDLDALFASDTKRASEVARLLEKRSATTPNIPIYEALLRTLRHKKQFATWLVARLQAVPQTDWIKDLRGNENWLGLAVELRKNGFEPGLSQSFRAALLEYADELQSGAAQPLHAKGNALQGLMDPSDHAIVEDSLLSGLLADATSRSEDFFVVFGSLLRDHHQVTSDNTIVSRVFVPLIEGRHVAGVRWIRNLVEEKGIGFLNNLDPARVQAFRRAISHELRDGAADQVRGDVSALAKRLGVRKASRLGRRSRG